MSDNVKAVFCFCEGAHDVAFTRKILRRALDYHKTSLKFSEMPFPLNKLFARSVEKHVAKDLALDMAHKFYLPDVILKKDDRYVLVFNSEGKDQYEKVKTFLNDYLELFEQREIFARRAKEIIKDSRFLFIYDADENGIDGKIDVIRKEYNKVGEHDFLIDGFTSSCSLFGKIANDKAIFIWGEKPERGTLEDVVLPMLDFEIENQILKEKTEYALKDIFAWEIDPQTTSVPKIADYKKALLTIAGQKNRPGKSLSVVLAESDLVPASALSKSIVVKEFIKGVALLGFNTPPLGALKCWGCGGFVPPHT